MQWHVLVDNSLQYIVIGGGGGGGGASDNFASNDNVWSSCKTSLLIFGFGGLVVSLAGGQGCQSFSDDMEGPQITSSP